MRSLLAVVAVLLGSLIATAALVAYVAHQSVLDPAQVDDMAVHVLEEDDLRNRLLNRVLPGYSNLPPRYRDQVDLVAESEEVRRNLGTVRIDSQGKVRLGPMRRELARGLRGSGYSQFAAQVENANGSDVLRVPPAIWKHYLNAREIAWLVSTRGSVMAVALFLFAVLLAPNRRRSLQGVGVALLVSAGFVALLYWMLPELVPAVTEDPWVQAVSSISPEYKSAATAIALPVAVAGFVVIAVSFVIPRSRRLGSH